MSRTREPGEVLEDEQTPGLAGERTDLAWSRSGLAVVTCAGAILRRLVTSFESVSARLVVFGLIAVGGVAWMAAMAHARAVARSTIEGRIVADARALRVTAYGTTALAVASLVLAI